jgi:hypothetical protein
MATKSIDLHGLLVSEALDAFLSEFNARARRRDRSEFSVIHGYGSLGGDGAIRTRLRSLLRAYPAKARWRTGESADGNPGHTLVIAIEEIPQGAELIAQCVLAHCANAPTTAEKIANALRRFPQPEVLETVKRLHSTGALSRIQKGRFTCYQTNDEA